MISQKLSSQHTRNFSNTDALIGKVFDANIQSNKSNISIRIMNQRTKSIISINNL